MKAHWVSDGLDLTRAGRRCPAWFPRLLTLGLGCLADVTPADALGQSPPARATHATGPDLSQYAAASISNAWLRVTFYLPDPQKGYYRGTRFDWSGLISRVEHRGHTFFCEFKPRHDPIGHDDICGTAEEFGMTRPPLGFEQARPGQGFVKIGIGVLERPDNSEYGFWKNYRVLKAGDWRVTQQASSVEFHQRLQGLAGWSYDYTKTLRLAADEPALRITRCLKNIGAEAIDTDHYGHNFLRIDHAPAGPDYTLEFPFVPQFSPDAKPQGAVDLQDRSLVFRKEIWEPAVWTPLSGFAKPEDNQVRVSNRRTGASMLMLTDRPLTRLVFYSSGGVLSPEPFVRLTIPPGKEVEWTTTYRFAAPDAR